jgi:hypothetical protein
METYTASKASRNARRDRVKGRKERRMRQQKWRSENFNLDRELSRKYKYKQGQRIRNRRDDKMGWDQPTSNVVDNGATNDNAEAAHAWDIHITLLAWENHIMRTEQDNNARVAAIQKTAELLGTKRKFHEIN